MRKRSPTDVKYEEFLKRRKLAGIPEGIVESIDLVRMLDEVRDIYGDPIELAAWEAENAEQNAAFQARYEAENADG